ncbi:hypothetical protein M8494_04435 [Serratia ureilytica]
MALGPDLQRHRFARPVSSPTLPFASIMVIAAVAALGVMFSWPRGVVAAPTRAAPTAEKARCSMACVSPAVNSLSVPGRCLSVGPGRQHFGYWPQRGGNAVRHAPAGVFGYAIAVYLLIAGISQI